MERLTNKKEADTQRLDYENRLKNGYPRNIPEERFLKLAAYEDTTLEPEDITDLMAAHGTAILALSQYQQIGPKKHLQELAQAEKDGRLVVLQDGITVRDLQNEYYKAKHMADEQLPSPSYTTGRVAGFGDGVMHILDKILTREEAKVALKKREADNEHLF